MRNLLWIGVLAGAAALSACDKLSETAAEAKKAVVGNGTTAEAIQGVDSFILTASSCGDSIRAALRERGYAIKDKEADAILEVTVDHSGRNLDNIPSFGGVGNKANWSLRVLGVGDKVLMQTNGNEGSATYKELCGDIGDEIAASLRKRTG